MQSDKWMYRAADSCGAAELCLASEKTMHAVIVYFLIECSLLQA